MLKRPVKATGADPLLGWLTKLSRLVCSMPNRSTSGVKETPGGKCPPTPIGATYPGPYRGDVLSVRSGLESTSRWVTVDWLMNWMVREVRGAALLAKKAAVRASATAPSMEKLSSVVLPVIVEETLFSTRT